MSLVSDFLERSTAAYFLTLYKYYSWVYLVIKNIKRHGYMPEENVVHGLLILDTILLSADNEKAQEI